MTSSPAAALHGVQSPRLSSVPSFRSSAGREVVEFAASFGLVLDPWQQIALDGALGERADSRWSAFEVGVIVSRQNGKGALLEARELAGLFLLDEQLVIHTAHEFKTAAEGFVRVKSYIDNYDHLRKRVRLVRTGAGTESIELRNGARLRFVARSAGSGRGFSGDCVLLDEAYALTDAHMAALLPTLSARPNPQVWYTSSAGMSDSAVLARVRARAREARASRLAYFEWSADEHADSDDRAGWAQANPALGIRIDEEFVVSEREAMSEADFRRERLGIWSVDEVSSVIDMATWHSIADPDSQIAGEAAFAVDAPWDRSSAVVAAGGRRADGRLHCELMDTREGTAWVVDYVRQRAARWRPAAVLVDAAGPAASLLADLEPVLEELGVPLVKVSGTEMTQGCGAFYTAAVEDGLRHLGDSRLADSLAGATRSDRGDVWRWDRRDSRANIAPLVAATLAVHGAMAHTAGGVPNLW